MMKMPHNAEPEKTAASAAAMPAVKLQPQISYIGTEQTPVIVIDNFAASLSPLLDYAVNRAPFGQDPASFYPGVRATLPKQYVVDVLNQLYQLIYHVYQIPNTLRIQMQALYFSLISTAPDDLKPLQRLPHFDTASQHYFAILHYLNDGEHGNTAFFRHIPTGFESINDARTEDYFAAAQPFVSQLSHAKPAYFVESNQDFEIYHQVEYRPNRLVIYPGNLLHSTLVNPETDIDASPSTGRLTANIFIEFKPG